MENNIRILRIIALLLFIAPALGLVGSLLVNNYLVKFNFTPHIKYNFKENRTGNSVIFICNKENNYCSFTDVEDFSKINTDLEQPKKLDECNIYEIKNSYYYKDGGNLKLVSYKDIESFDKEFLIKYEVTDKLSPNCILNSKSKTYYDLFPIFYETIYKIKSNEKTNLGTTDRVNPFIYGETSISNIVKRFPINYFFKPILYISVVFMISYWIYYNRVFKDFIKSSENFYFFKFGILSAIFLLLHVFFLGWTFESELLTKLRRTLIIFFILFEVLAQAFLIKKIFFIKDKMKDYIYSMVVYLKFLFVVTICLTTFSILMILMIFDLSPKVDYILEWNYFLVLLFFYFLSFLMWKKLN